VSSSTHPYSRQWNAMRDQFGCHFVAATASHCHRQIRARGIGVVGTDSDCGARLVRGDWGNAGVLAVGTGSRVRLGNRWPADPRRTIMASW
jgi:hypothetical protein